MTRTRWAGLGGVLAGAGLLAMFVVGGSTPETDEAGAGDRFVKYWNDDSHQTRAVAAAIIVSFVFLLLMAFASGLHERLRTVDDGPLPSFVRSAGTAAATLIAAGGVVFAILGIVAKQSTDFEVTGSTALVFDSLGYGLAALGFMAAAAMAAVTGLVTLRTKVLPAWTAWLGFLAGLGAIGSYWTVWADFIVVPVWALVIGIVLLTRSDAAVDGPGAPLAT